jgi:hypothetical protein
VIIPETFVVHAYGEFLGKFSQILESPRGVVAGSDDMRHEKSCPRAFPWDGGPRVCPTGARKGLIRLRPGQFRTVRITVRDARRTHSPPFKGVCPSCPALAAQRRRMSDDHPCKGWRRRARPRTSRWAGPRIRARRRAPFTRLCSNPEPRLGRRRSRRKRGLVARGR